MSSQKIEFANCKSCKEEYITSNSKYGGFCSRECFQSANKSNLKLKSLKIPKRCKGTSKAIGYGCNEPQQERIFGLGKKCGCYKEWLLHTPQGQEYLKSVTLKITQPRIDLQNAQSQRKDIESDHLQQWADKASEDSKDRQEMAIAEPRAS
jgi:hypothetical protein